MPPHPSDAKRRLIPPTRSGASSLRREAAPHPSDAKRRLIPPTRSFESGREVPDDVEDVPTVHAAEDLGAGRGAVFADAHPVGIGIEAHDAVVACAERFGRAMEIEVLVRHGKVARVDVLHVRLLHGVAAEAAGSVVHAFRDADADAGAAPFIVGPRALLVELDVSDMQENCFPNLWSPRYRKSNRPHSRRP